MFDNQRDHDHSQRARGARNHAWPAAEQGSDQTDDESGIEPYERRHAGNKGEGNSLRHKCQRHGETRQDFNG